MLSADKGPAPNGFGIYSLHNYIWETRQRHMGRQWTAQETDAMQSHIEPALRCRLTLLSLTGGQKRRQSSREGQSLLRGGLTAHLLPSTFGCLVLIYSLHNYIWETRQRHMGRQWTAQETETNIG
jgi:uncharacterized membrane protein